MTENCVRLTCTRVEPDLVIFDEILVEVQAAESASLANSSRVTLEESERANGQGVSGSRYRKPPGFFCVVGTIF
jgi:hypothetical protein